MSFISWLFRLHSFVYDRGGAVHNALNCTFGIAADGVTDDRDSINTLVNHTIPSVGGVIYFASGTYLIGSDLTIPSHVMCEFAQGARLLVKQDKTVKIQGPLAAGLYQIFSGDGEVKIGPGKVHKVRAEWWGVMFDGTNDDTAAFRKAITGVPGGGCIHLPEKRTILSGTIKIDKPLAIVGPGNGKACIDCRLPIDSEHALFEIYPHNLDTGIPHNCSVQFHHVTFDGSNAPPGKLNTRHIIIFVRRACENIFINGCRFLNLTRKGEENAGGNASLESEYAIYLSGAKKVRITDCEFSEISGVAVFVKGEQVGSQYYWTSDVWIKRNYVAMLTSGDCLYPIHLENGCDGVWIMENKIVGGRRASGRAIDVMSNVGKYQPPVNRRVYVEGNIINGSDGFGSGTACLRFLSVEGGVLTKNIVYNIKTLQDTSHLIHINARSGCVEVGETEWQPGSFNNLIAENILICGDCNQRAIDVRNDNPEGNGGENIIIKDNICARGEGHYFAAGIRLRDIKHGILKNNIVEYKYSAETVASFGIDITALNTMTLPLCEGNYVDCFNTIDSCAIMVQGLVSKPIVRGNTIVSAKKYGIRLESSVFNPTYSDNIFEDTPVPVSNASLGNTTAHGNRFDPAAARSGTWKINKNNFHVEIYTTEVRLGDRITLNITSDHTTDKPVKAVNITNGTSFEVKTFDHSTVDNDIEGTWEIEH
jgi:hypothetical protein